MKIETRMSIQLLPAASDSGFWISETSCSHVVIQVGHCTNPVSTITYIIMEMSVPRNCAVSTLRNCKQFLRHERGTASCFGFKGMQRVKLTEIFN